MGNLSIFSISKKTTGQQLLEQNKEEKKDQPMEQSEEKKDQPMKQAEEKKWK